MNIFFSLSHFITFFHSDHQKKSILQITCLIGKLIILLILIQSKLKTAESFKKKITKLKNHHHAYL